MEVRVSKAQLRDWYYDRALRRLPFACRRVMAILHTLVRLVADDEARVLSRAFSAATGLASHCRLVASFCWQQELTLTFEQRLTPEQMLRSVQIGTRPPSGGAVLIAPHQALMWAGAYALAYTGARVGVVVEAQDPRDPQHCARARLFDGRVWTRQEAKREGLALLRSGGYLVLWSDAFALHWPLAPLLGRIVPIPRGPITLARLAGVPLVPAMVVRRGMRWELSFGAPLSADCPDAVTHALTEAICRVPGAWSRGLALAWSQAPVAPPE